MGVVSPVLMMDLTHGRENTSFRFLPVNCILRLIFIFLSGLQELLVEHTPAAVAVGMRRMDRVAHRTRMELRMLAVARNKYLAASSVC